MEINDMVKGITVASLNKTVKAQFHSGYSINVTLDLKKFPLAKFIADEESALKHGGLLGKSKYWHIDENNRVYALLDKLEGKLNITSLIKMKGKYVNGNDFKLIVGVDGIPTKILIGE